MEKTLLSSSKMKDISWEREDYLKFDKDYPYGYPWPPRYYTCSFCQREFKSAQALGGHMNIHRKDRARLRDLSPDNNPFLSSNSNQNPNPNPNPNPNLNPTSNLNSKPNPNPNSMISLSSPSSSCPTNNIYAQKYSLVSLSLATIPPSQEEGKCKKMSTSFDEQRVMILESSTSTKEVVRLDLELCLGEAKEDDDDDLDLELRLGF